MVGPRYRHGMFSLVAMTSYDNDLEVSKDLGKNWKKIHKHIYTFGVQGKFIFVSVFLDKERLVRSARLLSMSSMIIIHFNKTNPRHMTHFSSACLLLL